MQNKDTRKIGIIGGGPGGFMTVANIIAAYRQQQTYNSRNLPEIVIDIYDPGEGEAFQNTLDTAILSNTPVGMTEMETGVEQLESFTAFAKENAVEGAYYAPETCFPRRLFGAYMDKQWRDLKEIAQETHGIALNVYSECVNQAESDHQNGWHLTLNSSGAPEYYQSLMIATGPPNALQATGPSHLPHTQQPSNINEIQRLVAGGDSHSCVAIKGFGPSALDALGALDKLDYSGNIVVYDPAPRTPWALDGVYFTQHRNDNFYEVQYLVPSAIHPGMDAEDMIGLMQADEEAAREQGCDPAITYMQYPDLMQRWIAETSPSHEQIEILRPEFETLFKRISGTIGIATAPERLKTYESWYQQGRLTFRHERMDANRLSRDNYLGVIDTARYARSVFDRHAANPALVNDFIEKGVIKEGDPAAGRFDPVACYPGLEFGYSPRNPVYGVGIAAGAYKQRAENLLHHALNVASFPKPVNKTYKDYSL